MEYTEERVQSIIKAAPLIRHVGTETASQNGSIFFFFDEDHLSHAVDSLRRIKKPPLVTLLRKKRALREIAADVGFRVIPLGPAMDCIGRDLVMCVHAEARKTNHLIRTAQNRGRETYWISSARNQQGHPNLLKDSKEKILRIVNGLTDEESVFCYLCRLKGLIHGHAGYLRMSAYSQYFHPIVGPREGDIICEGGIGGSANTTILFGRHVGESGKVFGFEPVNHLYELATARTAAFPHIVIENMGLWSKPSEMEIYLAEQVSTLRRTEIHGDKPKQACKVTSIDNYFAGRNVLPTMIKLDIEGAEQDALKGAVNTIAEAKPKLQICLYHSIRDFIDIPLSIMDSNLGYKLFVGHHTPYMNECLLYAIAG